MSCFQQSEGLPKHKLQLNSTPHINTYYVVLFSQSLWEKGRESIKILTVNLSAKLNSLSDIIQNQINREKMFI